MPVVPAPSPPPPTTVVSARPAGVRYVPNQILTPVPGSGRLEFSIPHPVVLDDGASVVVYVRGVAVPSDGYAIATDVGGDGISITFQHAPFEGDLVTISGFCRE